MEALKILEDKQEAQNIEQVKPRQTGAKKSTQKGVGVSIGLCTRAIRLQPKLFSGASRHKR